MRRCLLVVPCLALVGCQSATETRVRLHTDVEHAANVRVAMWAGGDTTVSGEPAVATQGPWSRDGVIGSIHLVPRDDNRESQLALRAVLGIDGQDPASCVPGNARCIVSTRRLRYLKHKRLTVPLGLYRRCLGVVCASDNTCNAQGACVPDALDADACVADDGCILPGDPPTPPGVSIVSTDGGTDALPTLPVAPVPRPIFLDSDPRRGFVDGLMNLGDTETLPQGGTLVGRELRWVGAPAAMAIRVPAAQKSYAFLANYRAPEGAEFIEVRNVVSDALGREVLSEPVIVRGDNYVRRLDIAAGSGADSVSQALPLLTTTKLLVLTRAPDNRVSIRICSLAGTQCIGKQLPGSPPLARIFADVDPLDSSRGLLVTGINPETGRMSAVRCDLEATACTVIAIPKAPPVDATRILGRIEPSSHDAVLVFGGDGDAPVRGFATLRCPSSGAACTVRSEDFPAPTAEGTAIDDVSVGPMPGAITVVGRTFEAAALSIFRSHCDASGCKHSLTDATMTESFSEGLNGTTLYDAPLDDAISLVPTGNGTVQLRRCSGATGKLNCTPLGGPIAAEVSPFAISFIGPPVATNKRPIAILARSVLAWNLLRCTDAGCTGANLEGALGSTQLGEGAIASGGTSDAPEVRIVAPNADLAGAPSHLRMNGALNALSVSTIGGNKSPAGSVRQDLGGESRMRIAYDASGKIVVTATNPTIGDRVSSFRCDSEGASCVHLPLESVEGAGRSNGVGFGALPLFDQNTSRFIFLTSDRRSGSGTLRAGRTSAFFCDGTIGSCSFLDVVLGRSLSSPWGPPEGAVVNLGARGRRVVSAARDGGGQVRVATCEVGGGDCSIEQHAWGEGNVALVEADGAIVVQRSNLSVERCPLATAGCEPIGSPPRDGVPSVLRYATSSQNITTMAGTRDTKDARRISVVFGQLPGASVIARLNFTVGNAPYKGSLVVDEARSTIYALVGTQGVARLLRCKVGSGTCDVAYESSGLLRAEPALSLRPDGKRLFVAVGDDANNGRPSLLVLDL